MKILIAFLAALLLMPAAAQAATVYGNVYDLSLNRAEGALVSIDTTPVQQIIAEDGSYFFTVGIGSYTLTAETVGGTEAVNESVLVETEGDYRIDLILFPVFEDEELPDVGDIDFGEAPQPVDYTLYILVLVAALILVVAWLAFRVKGIEKEPEEKLPEELEKVLDIIKREGKRVTQRELVRELGLSEAKVSLMVADLESRGLVKKIKKGRGNILVLK